jgi:hypothetical protein
MADRTPGHTAPRHLLLLVPVTPGRAGALAVRTARLPSGQRTGLAFTSEATLHAALGPGQPWIRLSEPMIRDLLAPLGVAQLRLDPLALHQAPQCAAA